MEETKKKLYVERDGFWTEAAIVLVALSMVLRLIGSIGRWEDTRYLTTQIALPIFCGLLLILCLLLFGKRAFWTTVLPVAMGVVFFIFRAMNMENEWQRGCWIIVYLVIMVLYAMVFSYPRLKWALALVLLGVFAYHIGVQDLPKLMDLEHPVSFVDGMEEMSVLGTILAMLFVSLAMKSAPKKAKKSAESTPEPKTEELSTPAEEPVPAAQEEKKLSRREQRRLEKQRKLEEKRQEKEPQPEPQPEPEPEPQPEPQLEEAVLPETESVAALPAEEVPMEELSAQVEAAAAYPLEEALSPEENESATEDP